MTRGVGEDWPGKVKRGSVSVQRIAGGVVTGGECQETSRDTYTYRLWWHVGQRTGPELTGPYHWRGYKPTLCLKKTSPTFLAITRKSIDEFL